MHLEKMDANIQIMEITKAQWTADGNNVRLSMPLSKVDRENRMVHGFASLDNVDSHDDVVEASATLKAFGRFRGNIREMHQPIAVGKMVDFREEEFYDAKDNKMYRGAFVSAYVSKGAQDTWEKVLDGTLTGFSIGGSILDSTTEFNKDAGKPVRRITDYELIELSLVDNPANQLANIFAIEKVAGGEQIMKGTIATVDSGTAFYCYEDAIAKVSTDEEIDCPNCGNKMVDIGWFEYNSDDKSEKTAELIKKYLDTINNTQEVPANNEGGVDVADTVEKSAQPSGEDIAVDEQGKAETEVDSSVANVTEEAEVSEVAEEEAVDEAADVSEVEDAEDDLAKMFDGFKNEIQKVLESNVSNVNEAIGEVNAKFDEFSKTMDEKVKELSEKHGELSQKFAEVKDSVGKMEKSVSALEDSSAVKKSNDLGGSAEKPEEIKKSSGSMWGGHFLGIDSLRD